MSNDRRWHSEALCKLTKKLIDLKFEVYSECLTKELELIELRGRVLKEIDNS